MKNNKGEKCKKCGKGIYECLGPLDFINGILNCNKCGDEIDLYTYIDQNIKDFIEQKYLTENNKQPIDKKENGGC